VLAFCGQAHAQSASTAGQDILRIESATGPKSQVELSLSALESLPHTTFTTKTPWYNGPVTFEGVLMRDLMNAEGLNGKRVVVTCLDKYSVEIPFEDVKNYNVILAYKRDGKYMPISDRGPLFVVYPYDSDPVLQADKFYVRSAWQVSSMTIE
jgi:hypothetical protein